MRDVLRLLVRLKYRRCHSWTSSERTYVCVYVCIPVTKLSPSSFLINHIPSTVLPYIFTLPKKCVRTAAISDAVLSNTVAVLLVTVFGIFSSWPVWTDRVRLATGSKIIAFVAAIKHLLVTFCNARHLPRTTATHCTVRLTSSTIDVSMLFLVADRLL